jgi:hypothetical protein
MATSKSCAGNFADDCSAWCSQALGVLAKTNSVFLTSAEMQKPRPWNGVVGIERGMENPTLYTIQAIAEGLGVTVDELMRGL